MMLPLLLIVLGLAGFLLVAFHAPQGAEVGWAAALLAVNLWIGEKEKMLRRKQVENRGSR